MGNLDVQTIFTVICGCVTFIYAVDKFINFGKEKFNVKHIEKTEEEHMKEMLTNNTQEINALNEQNRLIIEGVRNLLRQRIKEEALEYISRQSITTEELDEFNITYNIYKNMGGNGTGTKYHDEVLKLNIETIKSKAKE